MARVNVFLPDELLEKVDDEATASGTRRSTLIQGALRSYLAARAQEREETRARREMADAAKGMDALAEKLGSWDPVRVIREFRESRTMQAAEPSAPYRAERRKKRK